MTTIEIGVMVATTDVEVMVATTEMEVEAEHMMMMLAVVDEEEEKVERKAQDLQELEDCGQDPRNVARGFEEGVQAH